MMSRILIVDDNTDLLKLIELKLSQEGYEVILADNGFSGLKKAAELPPDMIILDIMMPEMDGWEFCARIRESSNVPILMLTARSEDEDVIKGLGLGADEYLTKPFRLNTLSARIEAMLRRRTWDTSGLTREVDALKDNILAALSQELRTPVALILNALELALREAFREDLTSQRAFIREARENAESLRWLIEDLLMLVRIDEGLEILVRPTSIHNLLHRIINRSENDLATRGVQVHLMIEADENVMVDQVLMRHSLHHLFKHTIIQAPDRSDVMIMIDRSPEGFLFVDFHDSGPGLSPEMQEQIFDRFFQPPNGQGWRKNSLGIGMHIAREIARAHGGNITVLSKPEEGSTFRLSIPIDYPDPS